MAAWLLMLKQDEPASDWGFATDRDEFARMVLGDQVRALVAKPEGVLGSDWPAIASVSAVVLHRGLCEDLVANDDGFEVALQAWLEPLTKQPHQLFVHFGGQPARGMTLDDIDVRWQRLTYWQFLRGNSQEVRPFSMQSGAGGSNERIRLARSHFKDIVNDRPEPAKIQRFLTLVAEAWADAGRMGTAATEIRLLTRCVDAYVAFQQVLLTHPPAPTAGLVGDAAHVAQMEDGRRKDAVALTRGVRAELARRTADQQWLTALDEVIATGAADPSLKQFCDLVQSSSRWAARAVPAVGVQRALNRGDS